MRNDRLYGTDEDEERLHTSIADLVEDFEARLDPEETAAGRSLVVREFTVHPPTHHLPDVGHLTDMIGDLLLDWSADNGEADGGFNDALGGAVSADVVRAGVADMIKSIADLIDYRMVDHRVATHAVVWDDEGAVTVDGEPLWRVTGPLPRV